MDELIEKIRQHVETGDPLHLRFEDRSGNEWALSMTMVKNVNE